VNRYGTREEHATTKRLDGCHSQMGKEMNAKTGIPRLDMQDTYTTIDSIPPLILEFSRGM
jgi:hypothetical protein